MSAASTQGELSKKSKLSAYLEWFSERFPALNFISAFLLFTFIFSYSLSITNGTFSWTLKETALAFGLLFQLLLLRVLDEFKDNEYDKEHHPDRVLQKGILKLNDLKIILFFCIGFQFALNFIYSNSFNTIWFVMMGWTYLMTKEFFIEEKLRKRVFLYLITHMIVMLFLVYWILGFYSLTFSQALPCVSMVFLGSILFEISRKSRGLDEDQRLDSYPKEVGFLANSALILALTIGLYLIKYFLIVNAFHWIYVWDLVAGVIFVGSLFYFHKNKNKKARKLLEANYGGMMMALYISFVLVQSVFS